MSKVCKVCGWENEDSDRVCAMCNTDLSDVASSNNANTVFGKVIFRG